MFVCWMSDCCLTPNEHFFFSYIMAKTSYISMTWWWWWCPLKQQSADRHVPPRGHLSWFRVKRFLLLFFNDASLAKKQQIPIVYIVFWFDPTGSRTNAIHRTRCEHVNQSIKCVFYCCFCFFCVFLLLLLFFFLQQQQHHTRWS